MKIVAFVPAKSTSKRIDNKNLSIIDGDYLFRRKLKQLIACKKIDEVYLDSDSEYMYKLVEDLPVKFLQRSKELATNETDGHELFNWESESVDADIYIQALCTAPFITSEIIDDAIDKLIAQKDHDSLIAIQSLKQYLWSSNKPDYGLFEIPQSVDLPSTIVESMSLYMVKSDALQLKRRFGNNPLFYKISPEAAVDINNHDDLVFARTVADGNRSQENLKLKLLQPYINTAMLSDITRELGLELALPSDIKGNSIFFGRAKTLLIDKLEDSKDWRKIYNALESYNFITAGDVIVVDNKVEGHAYFGNLNAQLALRSGAVGAVLNSITRDKRDLDKLNFPVFSKGHYCVDIKHAGVTKQINTQIKIGNVKIKNGDYIFADQDGVISIPSELWPKISDKIFTKIKKEIDVGLSINLGTSISEILKGHDGF